MRIMQVKYDTVEYWHKIYAENMKEFFAIFDSLTEGVTIGVRKKGKHTRTEINYF